jgi:uncharacterized protein (DUF427 family)
VAPKHRLRYSATAGGETRADVMWAYEHPYEEMLAIRNHGAFYSEKVNVETVEPTKTDRPIP